MNILQQLKAYGHFPDVELADCERESAMMQVRESQLAYLNRQCGHPDRYDAEIANADPQTLSIYLGLPTRADALQLIESHQRIEQYNNRRVPKGCQRPGPIADLQHHQRPGDVQKACFAMPLRQPVEDLARGVPVALPA